ncbi:MAG TPA: hypothetical protein VLE53_01840, partial [Gemmatimonadaceae bacterium]|nr:hypothetical protein [Gemmatimonadaceae bacterium]
MIDMNAESARREFLGRLAAGSAVLLAGASVAACAAEADAGAGAASGAAAATAADGEWLGKIHGTHRQFFDATHWNDGFGLAYAFNWARSTRESFNVGNDEVCAVIGLRHFAIAPAFSDAIWQKYKLGQFFQINDPKTKQPSVRNFAYNETAGDFMFAGVSLGQQIPTGAVVTVCNLATTVVSGMAAQAAGLSITPEAAYEEWKAALQPGCYL